jgi:hypothetical protein
LFEIRQLLVFCVADDNMLGDKSRDGKKGTGYLLIRGKDVGLEVNVGETEIYGNVC